MSSIKKSTDTSQKKTCFVIMPIADMEGYPAGHFTSVYNDIIKPSIDETEFTPFRADDTKAAHIIHTDIIKKIVECPVAICDVSGRNPNVLFELGIRQAFDKPVIILKDKKTPSIFDISSIRYIEYSSDMKYREVIQTQKDIKTSIEQTMNPKSQESNVNSLIKLMILNNPAQIPLMDTEHKEYLSLDILRRDMNDLKKMVSSLVKENNVNIKPPAVIIDDDFEIEFNIFRLKKELALITAQKNSKKENPDILLDKLGNLLANLMTLKINCRNISDAERIDEIIKQTIDLESSIT